jgi:hypothetical protein
MNQTLLMIAKLGAICLCVVMAAACGGDEGDIAATPTATAPQATPASPEPTSPGPEGTPITPATDISTRGEQIETLANTVLQQVTWEDGTTYEETISDLVFRTAGKPDAGHGHRVVARWLGDTSWQVIIYMRVVDRSTEPQTVTDLTGEFYYGEESAEFTAANGRGLFALTGKNPCLSDQPEPEYCPLDEEVSP